MGLKNGSKVKWKATGLTLHTLNALNLGNRIDVDGNTLVFKICGNTNKPLVEVLSLMAQHLKQLAYSGGYVITVIFDSVERPDCKRATLERRKKSFLADTNRLFS